MDEPKKQSIINAAIDLFAECGVSNVSIVMLSKHLGASPGMIYHYFKNGKSDIISEILQIFEDCISNNVANRKDWKSKDANADAILFSLFFKFPADDTLRLRKIVRIIMSEMYFNTQIAQHAMNYLISGREEMLSECLASLANDEKIQPLDADSIARCMNRVVLAYAIEDSMRYPFTDDEGELDEQTERMICDCTNIIKFMITKRSDMPDK